MPQSPDFGQISDEGFSDFRISTQSLIKENCQNSRTSDDADMKLWTVTKTDKKSKIAWKDDGDIMFENCDITTISSICGQFGAIRKSDSGGIVCKT